MPEYWRQRFHAHVSVAPEHSAAYDALLDRLIKDVLGQSVKWQWRDFTVRLRERWDAEIRQLPVPARGAAAPVYRDEDLYSAVLRDFYTHIALSVNGRDVYTARNNTAEDTHAEDEVIRELLKDANWVAWRRSGIAHGQGDLVHVQLTNSPCGTRCAGRLVQCLAHLRDRDPQLQMKISFMNAHELAQGNFKTSITTLEQAGIETVAVSGASLADRARAAILAKYPEQLDEERLTDLIAARTQRDAATKRAHDEVVATFTFPRQPAQQRQAPVPTAQVPPAVVAAVFAIFFLAWLQSVLWAQDAATK